MRTRALPLRVDPLPGEALDSWLEAIATRSQTPYGEVLRHLGFPTRTQSVDRDGKRPPSITHRLAADELARLAAATGLDPDRLARMTLASYGPHAVEVATAGTRRVNLKHSWGRGTGSRFCPDCLAATAGRWQLSWRLGWAFACVRHQRLLADCCPTCCRIPRHRPYSGRSIPQPGLCGNAPIRPGDSPTRGCGFNLALTETLRLPPDHPALHAQHAIEQLIAGTSTPIGLYEHVPLPAADVLRDLRALAQRMLTPALRPALNNWVPPDLLAAYTRIQHQAKLHGRQAGRPGFQPHGESERRPGFMAPSHAASTALAATAALHILNASTIQEAAARLRPAIVLLRRHSPQPVIPSSIEDWGKDLSPVLDSVHLAALAPDLRHSAQLRYRTSTPVPCRPTATSTRRARKRTRNMPAQLWPAWAIRLLPPGHRDPSSDSQRLAVCLAITATDQPLDEAATALGGLVTALLTSLALRRWSRTPYWPAMQEALIALADHLDDTQSPIDYARRRQLTHAPLLPRRQWQDICQATGLKDPQGTLLATARLHLRERISGTPMLSCFNPAHLHYARHWSPTLATQLEHAAQAFLTGHGITDEPVTWQPPLELVSSLTLPGPEITHRMRHHLHHAPGEPYYDLIGHTAAALGRPAQSVLALLAGHPDLHQDPPADPTPAQNPTDLLRPALADPHAPRQLRLFAAATAYPTLVHAGRALNCSPDTLTSTIRALEHRFNTPLQAPGARGRPVNFTPFARAVAATAASTSLHEMTLLMNESGPARDCEEHDRPTPTDLLKQHLGLGVACLPLSVNASARTP
ncbi:TniQ family protein [Streptomyces abikoensis]|uniref:TniQ family protein n=1 Tax=Streptomyces abikoensis TaxID=97398 RepID=A0ABW7TCT7_9ACTN